MSRIPRYVFCGVGGSGMAPLAVIMRARGAEVIGTDRGHDAGRTPEKFAWLQSQGVDMRAQDGSAITSSDQVLVTSAAVESTIPDVVAAERIGAARLTRAELLTQLFNAAPVRIGVAGTSGKSTVAAMIAWILAQAGRDPTVMNGAEMTNFVTPDRPFASALTGAGQIFVSEVDESDGSIALYEPTIAVVNNIAFDHKPVEALRPLFADFIAKASVAVLNLDNPETAALVQRHGRAFTYSHSGAGELQARDVRPNAGGVAFTLAIGGDTTPVALGVPGRHNVSNALAAIAAASAIDVPAEQAARALATFAGVRRRLETVGACGGVTVIDDFAHNPDKIAATLATLGEHDGRLLLMFQPHGYGPLKLMKAELAAAFAQGMDADDLLLMPEPAYFGGTVDRRVGSADLAAAVRSLGRHAEALPDRPACGEQLLAQARPGDRIVVMGARDDTLTTFARELLARLPA